MPITETTTDYEILVRLDENGFSAAQAQTKTTYKNGSTILTETINEPTPIDLSELKSRISNL